MFNFIEYLKYQPVKKNILKVKLKDLQQGINHLNDYIIVFEEEIKIYNRKCDHQGGRLVLKSNEIICPLHGWKFDALKGTYSNGFKKKTISYKILNNEIIIEDYKIYPEIFKINQKKTTNVRFFNHAFLKIYGENFSFVTDPWAFGPAFNTGWWLQKKTKEDWLSEVNKCDFLYISHNHPDHLHPLTLNKISKNIPIVVGKFTSDSAGKYMESLGFKKVFRLEFGSVYRYYNTDLYLSLLKSGDFRDDSGIYFSNGNLSCLFDVDSNFINFDQLPKVDIYGSSFGGGASGYPLMFDNYSTKEKVEIINNNKKNLFNLKISRINKILPKYFLPYASFFDEKLNRDKFIKKYNKKNPIDIYEKKLVQKNIKILNPQKYDSFKFYGKKLIKENFIDIKTHKDLDPLKYLEKYKKVYNKINYKFIKDYFLNSKFNDNLILAVSLTSDNFRTNKNNFLVDFSDKNISFSTKNIINFNDLKNKKKKILYLKSRKESFLNTVYNLNPWEDLMIGFQTKILRSPNIYNFKFWYHFSNIYIKSENMRKSKNCYFCDVLKQESDKIIYEKMAN
jgi:CMP-N-acetylneuraminate monooxygenase